MSEQTNTPGTAVALGAPVVDLDQAKELSRTLAVASVLPDTLRGKPADVLAMMLYGQDLGMSPMQSIQGIYVVKGKPQLAAATWIALARQRGHKVDIVESTDERCTVRVVRADDPRKAHDETFTLDDAVRAGLCTLKDGKPHARSKTGEPLPWESYTRTMLRNRAVSNAGKFACPEVAFGFGIEGDYDYIPEPEMSSPEHHGDVVDAEVVPEQVEEQISELAEEFDFSNEQTTIREPEQPE